MPRVICAGHVNWDVTIGVDHLPAADSEARITSQRQSGGGSASNAAVVFAGLECSTALLGSVGRDEHGWLARRELEDAGVDTFLVETQEGHTSVKYLIVDDDGEVAVLGNDGVNEAFASDDIPAATLADADHLHLTGQAPETATALAKQASDAGIPVSFDPGRRLGERDYADAFAHADLVFLNDREESLLSEAECLEASGAVVVKHGSGGAEMRTADATVTHPGFDVDPVDTTGSGDAFAAGFIAARFDGGDEYALSVGNACGALAARTTGARLHVSWRDVEALLDVGPSANPEEVI